ncbi:hypothetical protein EHJ11_21080 [Cronobacter turicensis]|uniref:hypothetical protein n=1 Tax=Cronobacter turicensis TaxID=413502 RepID=UPI00137581B8|nr:hypothetical protein [Cronobacter turicensis]NCH65293.1 hypothetical protein [Cronobacter turicensis]
MYSRKIYLRWSNFNEQFIPTALGPGEDLRCVPKQGYGASEIAAWLSSDFPNGINSIDIWIKNLINLGSVITTDGNFGMGNAHWVMVTQDRVFIGCEYVEEQQVLLTIKQTLYVLEQYRLFLEGSYTKDFPAEPIDVEYLAEGRDAITQYESLDGAHCLPY